jgi:hypothetical protein
MVNVLDLWVQALGQTKDYNIVIGCFSANHAALRNKSKDWLARNQNNVQNKILVLRAPTTFKLEGEVTSPSESSQGEVGDNREKWGETSGKC